MMASTSSLTGIPLTDNGTYQGQVVSKFVMPAGTQWPGKRSIEVVLDGDLDDIPLGTVVTVTVSSARRGVPAFPRFISPDPTPDWDES